RSCSPGPSRSPPSYCPSLHDALPIWIRARPLQAGRGGRRVRRDTQHDYALDAELARDELVDLVIDLDSKDRADILAGGNQLGHQDRKSTRLNSSHVKSSYAGFCLKTK